MKKIVSNPRKIIELLFKNYFEKYKGYIELARKYNDTGYIAFLINLRK